MPLVADVERSGAHATIIGSCPVGGACGHPGGTGSSGRRVGGRAWLGVRFPVSGVDCYPEAALIHAPGRGPTGGSVHHTASDPASLPQVRQRVVRPGPKPFQKASLRMSSDPSNLAPKGATIEEHRLHDTDTGSPEVQIACCPTASTTSPST